MSCSQAGQRTTETARDPDDPRSTSRDLAAFESKSAAARKSPVRTRSKSELPSRRSWAASQCLPRLRSQHRRGRTVGRRASAPGASTWERHATPPPDAAARRTVRVVARPAPRRRAVHLANATCPPTSPRRRTREGPRPIASVDQRLTPGQARLRSLRLPRESLEAVDALQT